MITNVMIALITAPKLNTWPLDDDLPAIDAAPEEQIDQGLDERISEGRHQSGEGRADNHRHCEVDDVPAE